ncbi:MAG: CBS domain-containing protein, partial [Nitrosopumilus sp.]|nr:CBS domain-containing protein [Nitrosopumilus sp.]
MTQLRSVLQMPITIQSDASLYHAISRLLQGDISRLIVTGGPDVQIVTEKDIGMFLLTDESGKALEDIPVSQIARRFVSVHENMTVQGAAEIMVDRDIGSVGVYCNDEGLIGIVTKTDLTKYYFENFVGHNRIGDLMTITYTSMDSEDSLNKVITKMIDERISRIFLKN